MFLIKYNVTGCCLQYLFSRVPFNLPVNIPLLNLDNVAPVKQDFCLLERKKLIQLALLRRVAHW